MSNDDIFSRREGLRRRWWWWWLLGLLRWGGGKHVASIYHRNEPESRLLGNTNSPSKRWTPTASSVTVVFNCAACRESRLKDTPGTQAPLSSVIPTSTYRPLALRVIRWLAVSEYISTCFPLHAAQLKATVALDAVGVRLFDGELVFPSRRDSQVGFVGTSCDRARTL